MKPTISIVCRGLDVYFDFDDYSPSDLAKILRLEIEAGGFSIESAASDKVLEQLFAKNTTPAQRSAMNGGLARQVFRKARGQLDSSLTLDSTPSEMCTLSIAHITSAMKEVALPGAAAISRKTS